MSNDNCVGCLTGYDVGLPSDAIAHPHPDCPEHGLQEKEYFPLKRKSMLTGVEHTMRFPECLRADIEGWLSAPNDQRLFVQEAFPTLDPDHREFLMTGITQDEWASICGEEE